MPQMHTHVVSMVKSTHTNIRDTTHIFRRRNEHRNHFENYKTTRMQLLQGEKEVFHLKKAAFIYIFVLFLFVCLWVGISVHRRVALNPGLMSFSCLDLCGRWLALTLGSWSEVWKDSEVQRTHESVTGATT